MFKIIKKLYGTLKKTVKSVRNTNSIKYIIEKKKKKRVDRRVKKKSLPTRALRWSGEESAVAAVPSLNCLSFRPQLPDS